jgi:probable F420-dependent oxidoreductase
MNFGLAIFPTPASPSPMELARMAEERGFESLFFPEHTHIPASRATPYPAGGELPPEYSRTHDPFVALGAAAAVTSSLRIGTGICLVIERDPIITAKEVASVDVISGGRFLFGVGAGWNLEEMRNHGTDPRTRFGRMRESVEAMREIWTQDEASYAGTHVSFDRIWCRPKPLQPGGPPVLVGGNADRAIDRAVAFGDEWMPNRVGTIDYMLERIASFHARAAEAGREPMPVTLSSATRDPAAIERYEQAGVHRGVFWLPPAGRDEVEAGLDRVGEAMRLYQTAGA